MLIAAYLLVIQIFLYLYVYKIKYSESGTDLIARKRRIKIYTFQSVLLQSVAF